MAPKNRSCSDKKVNGYKRKPPSLTKMLGKKSGKRQSSLVSIPAAFKYLQTAVEVMNISYRDHLLWLPQLKHRCLEVFRCSASINSSFFFSTWKICNFVFVQMLEKTSSPCAYKPLIKHHQATENLSFNSKKISKLFELYEQV